MRSTKLFGDTVAATSVVCSVLALFKESSLRLHRDTELLADSGYQGIAKLQAKSRPAPHPLPDPLFTQHFISE